MSSHSKEDDQLELGEDATVISLRKAWDRALRSIATKVHKSSFESFFATAEAVEFVDGVVTLAVQSRFAKEWLDKRYKDTIRSLLAANLDEPDLEVRFVLVSSNAQPSVLKSDASDTAAASAPAPQQEIISAFPKPQSITTGRGIERSRKRALPPELSIPLNDKYTFDTFVTGKSNRLAYAGAVAVADAPGLVYNPLFLYGQPGLGKTHLMHAIGHEIRRNRPDARIAYISGESFTNSYVTALRERRFDEFRSVYRNVDVWLVDDIQTIAGKEHTKEEFFHTFNTLHQLNRQIVLSSDRSPRELRMMDERLRSRFECGLIADVAPPELEMRVAILQKKAEVENIPIPEDVLIYMANLIQSNIRALEGALLRLMAYSSVYHSPLTKALAADVLGSYFVDRRPVSSANGQFSSHSGNLIESSGLRALPIPENIARLNESPREQAENDFNRIIEAVAAEFGISPDQIAGDGSAVTAKKKAIAGPRQIAIYLVRERTSLPVVEIAQMFGGISHSAVSHAHRKMTDQVRDNPQILAHISAISSRLGR